MRPGSVFLLLLVSVGGLLFMPQLLLPLQLGALQVLVPLLLLQLLPLQLQAQLLLLLLFPSLLLLQVPLLCSSGEGV